ncbi:hypothetical protein KAU33_15465 [Candidatus Dependentiae bacterium]|nr:hypothetical protein [Candidatus Dependentiae bacterium]
MGDNYSELELRKTENILNDIESRVLNMRRLLRENPDKIPVEVVNTKFIITTLLGELPVKSNVYSSE